MKVILAGASGTLGTILVRRLSAAGHSVIGIARSDSAAARIRASGAEPVLADVLDRAALLAAIDGIRADAVMHQLTALRRAPLRHRDMAATDELRDLGSAHLVEAAQQVGAARFVTQSIVFGYGYRNHGAEPLTEASPFGVPAGDANDPHVAAMLAAEQQVFRAPGIEGIALRYGLFYGADLPTVERMLRRRALPTPRHGGLIPLVHHEDAVAATVAALERGRAGAAYNIVDDGAATFRDFLTLVADTRGVPRPPVIPRWLLRAVAPYAAPVLGEVSMRVSSALARSELGWVPRYPTVQSGVAAQPNLPET